MKWVSLPQEGDVPLARSSHSVSTIAGDTLVLWGGENAPRVPVSAAVSLYALPTGVWTTVDPPGGPCMRVAHAAAAVDSTVYVHGGRTEATEDSTLGDLWAFDAAAGRWTELKPTTEVGPRARNYHAACAVGPSVYIFGGCGGSLLCGATRRLTVPHVHSPATGHRSARLLEFFPFGVTNLGVSISPLLGIGVKSVAAYIA